MDSIVIFTAQYLFLVIVAAEGAYLLAYHRREWLRLLIAAAAIGGVALLISRIANALIPDPRPFIVGGFTPLIHHSADNGFPSDHTLLLAATAAVTLIANRRAGIIGALFALIVGLARVYAGVHHLLDIAGSFVIVALSGGIYALALRLPRRRA
ncbi:MAG TPA: phosphatase PAP2 family protein [Rectinemataceae bacterium]|nr:phosphatase PAP2 family protein [Rectinemataceae bacterium]